MELIQIYLQLRQISLTFLCIFLKFFPMDPDPHIDCGSRKEMNADPQPWGGEMSPVSVPG